MRRFAQIVIGSFVVYFFSWVFVYYTGINTLAIQSEDTIPAVFLPVSIIKDGTFYVNNYYEMILQKYPHPDDKEQNKGLVPFYFKKITQESDSRVLSEENSRFVVHYPQKQNLNNYISAFPVMSGLLALPVYIIPLLLGMAITWTNLYLLSHIASALIMALAGGFFYLLVKKHFLEDEKKALTITFVYLFGTVNYALISQALWQHGSVQLFTILSLLFLFNSLRSEPKLKKPTLNIYLSGVFIGFAVLSRPTAALFMPFLFVLIYKEFYKVPLNLLKLLVMYLFGLILPVLFFIWYNGKYYKTVFNQGYASQAGSGWLSDLPEGFVGLWLSPSKGILIYSPVLIFSLVGIYLIIKNKLWKEEIKYILFAVIVILHILILGKWKHWYGGWSYGYRMASDILPFLTLMMVPYLKDQLFERTKKLFYSLFSISVSIELLGIIFFDGVWHAAYDDGFEKTGWLWSIKNSELAFNLRRILVKLNLLDKACPTCLPE